MVGAGIFSLLGTAGEVAGAAVWLSFVLAGIIAALQGYSFARLGARYPSAAGLIEYINRAFGKGHVATVIAWLAYASNGDRDRHGCGLVRQLRQQRTSPGATTPGSSRSR